MLEPLYTADEMRAAEAGFDVDQLMERAGRAVAEDALRAFPDASRFVAVCGKGANGGDGRIAVRVLAEAGREAVESHEVEAADVVIDALFGTGFSGEPRADAAALIARMNAGGAPVVAVDVPSGVDASTGEIRGNAVRAARTVTFHARKVGLEVAPGRFHAGAVTVADIGLGHTSTEHQRVTPEILRLVPRRAPEDNKYSAGSVLIVGGSRGMAGAVCLAAEAAFRADAGYVAVAVPDESLPVVEHRLLETVKRPLADLDDAIGRAGAVAVGPGLGRGDEQKDLVQRVLSDVEKPLVLDADALHELDPFERGAPTVLTPHSGELARLLGEESEWVEANRLEAVRRAAARFACVVLLKGADTLVASPDGRVLVSALGPPSLATAGTGDVLTGVLATFLAKGLEPTLAAAAGAAAQQVAARLLTEQTGVVASDVVAALPRALG